MGLSSVALLFVGFLLRYQVEAWQCSSCEVPYKAKGCYKDSSARVLKVQVLNERDRKSKVYGGRVIDWLDWNNYMPGFACRCAKIVKAKGWTMFGLQFYGECWSGPPGSFDLNSVTKTDACISDDYKPCGKLDRHCIGKQWINFVFELEPDCDTDFERLGCFKDNHKSPQPLPDYIMTDREKKLKIYSGQSIDWRNWDVYLPNFACRCAKLAKERGHTTFGIQYYGECWSGKNAEFTYNKLGLSNNCQNKCFKTCKPYEKYCAGKDFANTVYRLADAACEVSFEPVGCYGEQSSNRAFAKEILNEVDPTSPAFNGQILGFGHNWNQDFAKLLCRCARVAHQKGYAMFGVNDHGACWSDPNAAQRFDKHGPSDQCFMNYDQTCPAGSDACAGGANANFVYRVTKNRRRSFIENDVIPDLTSRDLPELRDETSQPQELRSEREDDIENLFSDM